MTRLRCIVNGDGCSSLLSSAFDLREYAGKVPAGGIAETSVCRSHYLIKGNHGSRNAGQYLVSEHSGGMWHQVACGTRRINSIYIRGSIQAETIMTFPSASASRNSLQAPQFGYRVSRTTIGALR